MKYRLLLGMAMVLSLSLSVLGATGTDSADSIIIGNATFAMGQNQVTVPVYFVTHGDITHYNLPLKLESAGDIHFAGRLVSAALQDWDDNWQGLNRDGSEANQMGFADLGGEDNPALNTNGRRVEALQLTFSVDEKLAGSSATISARIDQRTGGPLFGYSDGITGVAPVVINGTLSFGAGEEPQTLALPTEIALNQNYPNPFNPTTEIQFALPEAGFVRLTVFNVLGQEVRSLVSGPTEAGYHKVIWNGQDNTGRIAPSGAYFYRLDAGNFSQSMKMVLLK